MPTDEERLKAYEECCQQYDDPNKREGFKAIVGLLRGGFGGFTLAWAKMIRDNEGREFKCMDLLSAEQRAIVQREMKAKFKQEQDGLGHGRDNIGR